MNAVNFCTRIAASARRHPQRLAIALPDGACLRYGELLAQAGARQQALRGLGLKPGDRVLLLARPGLALYVLMVALLAGGIVPVLIDPGMSRARMLESMRLSGARVVIGERAILRLWWLFPALWCMRRFALDGRACGVARLPAGNAAALHCELLPPEAHGLITFTSGSTGAPKGADRNHGSLIAQHEAIRAHWQDRDDDIDMPCFPVLVLHNLCCGISTVLPAVDPATPGRPDAARVFAQLAAQRVTRLAAAPAFMAALVAHAAEHDLRFPGLRSLVVGGATLPPGLAQSCLRVFPEAECRVVYGSTEAEPIADVQMAEIVLHGRSSRGHLLGHVAPGTEVCVVAAGLPLDDEAAVRRAQLGPGESGEILVAGAHVLRRYVDNLAATRESKIARADGLVWHRTGDVGHRDGSGRLWLEGRLKDAVEVNGIVRHTLALEKALDALPGVARSALVAMADGSPALVLSGELPDAALLRERLFAQGFAQVRGFRIARMPVDGRHNSKIDRAALRTLIARGRLLPLGEL